MAQIDLEREIKMAKIDLEQEILIDLSDQFARDFDASIMRTIEMEHLIKQGWYQVSAVRWTSTKIASEVVRWTEQNCGRHLYHGTRFIFKDSQDAVLFKLKWG